MREPLAPFVDIFCLGEGEEVTGRDDRALPTGPEQEVDKARSYLRAAAQIPGLYVPSPL